MASRPLSQRESQILWFMLSAEFPGVEKLRQQAQAVEVIRQCECGCATIDLDVDEALPVAREVAQSDAVYAPGRPTSDGGLSPDLILFVNDGRLSSIEIVSYGDAPIGEFPSPDEFEPPAAPWFNADRSDS